MGKKLVVGLIEDVIIFSKGNKEKTKARIDTGAKSNSIDKKFAEKLDILPNGQTTIVKSAMGKAVREVVMIDIEIAGKKINGRFTLADRSHLKYPVLIGRNILINGFMIDPLKEYIKENIKEK